MNKGLKTEGGQAPAQQAQQPQVSKANAGAISLKLGKDESTGKQPKNASPVGEAALDEARFTAGVVKLYEALLKEPVPEKMLRLVEQLGKQERK